MQILIYVGAVCVVIMFAMMLAEPHEQRSHLAMKLIVATAGLLIAGLFSARFHRLDRPDRWLPSCRTGQTAARCRILGRALLTRYGFAFELISVVLLLAILGALVVARSGRRSES